MDELGSSCPCRNPVGTDGSTSDKPGSVSLLAFTTALGGFPSHPPRLHALAVSPFELSVGKEQGSGPSVSSELNWKLKANLLPSWDQWHIGEKTSFPDICKWHAMNSFPIAFMWEIWMSPFKKSCLCPCEKQDERNFSDSFRNWGGFIVPALSVWTWCGPFQEGTLLLTLPIVINL